MQRLLAAEKKAEEEVAKATSKEEKAEKLAEAKVSSRSFDFAFLVLSC